MVTKIERIQTDTAPITEALANATTRDHAHHILTPLTVGQLRAVAATLDICLRSTRKTQIVAAIVRATVGTRLDHAAIRDHNW